MTEAILYISIEVTCPDCNETMDSDIDNKFWEQLYRCNSDWEYDIRSLDGMKVECIECKKKFKIEVK